MNHPQIYLQNLIEASLEVIAFIRNNQKMELSLARQTETTQFEITLILSDRI